jgi:hypothetical protein
VTLTLIGGTAELAYLPLLVAAIYRVRPNATLIEVDRAIHLLMLAALTMGISAATWLMQYGWAETRFSLVLLAGTVAVITVTAWRADRMEGAR